MKLTQSFFIVTLLASFKAIDTALLRGGLKNIGAAITGRVGKEGVDAVKNTSFHTIDVDETDFFDVRDFVTFSPPDTPPESPRGSMNLFPSRTSSPNISSPTTPRNSFSNLISKAFLGSSRSRSTSPTSQCRTSSVSASPRNSSTITSPRTGSNDTLTQDPSLALAPVTEDQFISRTASSDRPISLDMILNLRGIPKTDLTLLPAKRMSSEVEAKVEELSAKFGHYDPFSEFYTNLNRILTYINQKFILTPFVAHLAAIMLQHLGAKAPKALELFLGTKMPFLIQSFWEEKILESGELELKFVDIVDNKKLLKVLTDIDRTNIYSEDLLEALKDNISAAFLDLLGQYFVNNFDEIMIFYSIIFDNCRDFSQYEIRIATFVKLLMEFTKEKTSAQITKSEIQATMNFEFKEFSEYFYENYGIDD